jgi:hypothetical protein
MADVRTCSFLFCVKIRINIEQFLLNYNGHIAGGFASTGYTLVVELFITYSLCRRHYAG